MNILALSYFYPPVTKPRAIQVSRLLSASSGRKLVLSGSAGREPRLVSDRPDLETVSVPWEIPRWRRSLHTILRRAGGSLAGSWEPYKPWRRSVLAAARGALADGDFRPEVIVTFGHPWIDHEIGIALKEELGVPLITHFSDPWVDNPLVGMPSVAAQTALRRRESAVLHASDCIIFTSDETVDLVMSHHPDALRQRTVVLPHSFDPDLFPTGVAVDPGAIRCLGKFYGERQPDALFRALMTLRAERPEVLSSYRFELIGNFDREGPGNGSTELGVTIRPSVPYLESLRLMSTAAALFLVDAPADTSVFLPSKLIEYIGAGKPVFGITPPGTADRLIRRYGGLTADPRDPDGVADMIREFLSTLPNRVIDESVRREFEMRNVGREFDRIVERCLAAGAA